MSKLILIFALIGFCLTVDTDQCYSDFKDFLDSECEAINSNCKYFMSIKKCKEPKTTCTDGTSSTCSSIIPTLYNIKKCKWGTTCSEDFKLCEDYDPTWGDTCENLQPESGKGDKCRLSYSKKCTPYFDSCTSITKQDQCNNNIPSEKTETCVWKNNACTQEKRKCDDSYHLLTSTDCPSLKATDSKKKCFYLNKACGEYYETCEDYEGKNKTICENLKPINSGKNGFDISKNCTFDDSSKICKTTDIMCEEYKLKGPEDNRTCFLLATSDGNKKKCIYDYEAGKCREDYLTCQVYNDLTGVQKKKEICENITLDIVTKKCVFKDNACSITNKECSDYKSYEPKENCTAISNVLKDTTRKECKFDGSACIEDYKTCTSYDDGNDKKTCESIMISDGKCFLKNDEECEKRKLTCAETKTEDECWKAESENSRTYCFYYGGQCIEMYSACENYIGYYKQECEAIVTGKGTTCSFQSPNCLSIFKSCSEALNSDECTLINYLNSLNNYDPIKSRLSDPKKMVCEYDSTSGCFENYKYCNDYKGTDAAVCEKIKPQTTMTLPVYGTVPIRDYRYKCVYKEKTGCERQLLGCSEAKTSTACDDISFVLKGATDSKKYCAFFNGTCTEQYTECGNYDKNVQKEECQAIIPENYRIKHCVYKDEGGTISCVEADNVCESLDVDKYIYKCISLGPFCSYSDGVCSTITKACSDVVFPLEWTGDRAKTCSGIKVENENKICSLSSDKTKCEEIDKPSEKEETPASSNSGTTSQNSQNSESQENSSDSSNLLQLKGIKLILTLLYLLI